MSAQSVGVDVPRVRLRLVLATALVVGAAVAVAGPIAFVGLLVPHLVRLAAGASHAALVPLSFLGGGVFLVIADVPKAPTPGPPPSEPITVILNWQALLKP